MAEQLNSALDLPLTSLLCVCTHVVCDISMTTTIHVVGCHGNQVISDLIKTPNLVPIIRGQWWVLGQVAE